MRCTHTRHCTHRCLCTACAHYMHMACRHALYMQLHGVCACCLLPALHVCWCCWGAGGALQPQGACAPVCSCTRVCSAAGKPRVKHAPALGPAIPKGLCSVWGQILSWCCGVCTALEPRLWPPQSAHPMARPGQATLRPCPSQLQPFASCHSKLSPRPAYCQASLAIRHPAAAGTQGSAAPAEPGTPTPAPLIPLAQVTPQGWSRVPPSQPRSSLLCAS